MGNWGCVVVTNAIWKHFLEIRITSASVMPHTGRKEPLASAVSKVYLQVFSDCICVADEIGDKCHGDLNCKGIGYNALCVDGVCKAG
jgi:hypothetical protein